MLFWEKRIETKSTVNHFWMRHQKTPLSFLFCCNHVSGIYQEALTFCAILYNNLFTGKSILYRHMPPNMKSTEKPHYKSWGFADRKCFVNYLTVNLPETVVGSMLSVKQIHSGIYGHIWDRSFQRLKFIVNANLFFYFVKK